ncbi:MAG: type II secretion system F family protein, partial [Armatimonadota bacterium]
MASSLRSGFSLLRAIQIVAQEMPPPISKEFARAVAEVGVGRPMEDALRSVVRRMRSYDLDLAVTAIIIHLQVGGNLAEILETIARTIRERLKILGEMRALTAEGRISGAVLVALPIVMALVLVVLNPGYIGVLIEERLGHYLIAGAVAMQILGGLVIKNMLSVDV